MLMKLAPGVNFTNILRAAFMCADPKSLNKTDSLTVSFVLLGSLRVKAELINVGEIDPRCQFHKRSKSSFCLHRSQKH